jgi:serine protease DegQ
MNLTELSQQLSSVVRGLGPSVVSVDGGHRRGASGLVWSADGLVLTAAHKVLREDGLGVGLADGTRLEATLVGHDPRTDVALLRTTGPALTPAPWAPLDGLEVGALVVAVARPGRTVRASLGMVSALSEGAWTTPAGGTLERYVETDIGGRAGYSGGALADASGRVLGMSTGGLWRGTSLAVPHATLARVVAELLAHGRRPRGWLGVGTYPVELPAALAERTGRTAGLVLVSVAAGGPAEQGGLLLGDVLLSIDGAPLPDVRALAAALIEGEALSVELVRGGQVHTLGVEAGARPNGGRRCG